MIQVNKNQLFLLSRQIRKLVMNQIQNQVWRQIFTGIGGEVQEQVWLQIGMQVQDYILPLPAPWSQ